MAFADLAYFGMLSMVVFFSGVVLLREFVRGDLAARRTSRWHRRYALRSTRQHRPPELRRGDGISTPAAPARSREQPQRPHTSSAA
jgi:hypothetical protein